MKKKTQKKHYMVTITAYAHVLVVSAESEEKALEYATEACRFGDLQMEEASISKTVENAELDSYRRDADVVADVESEEA